jgi:hypothetical protein
MRLASVLFVLLLAMAVVVGYVFVAVEESEIGHGFTHPELETMQRGGDGAERHEDVLVAGAVMGVLQIVFFGVILAFGTRRGRPMGMEEWVLVAGTVVFVLTWLMLVYTYLHYAAEGGGELAFSFPVPTAWMLFGVGFAPGIFILLYFLRFESWVLSDEEVEAFLQDASSGSEP